jgi:hypothetical protein
MDDLSSIPDDFLSDGDTASGAIEGERIVVRCVDVEKAIRSGLDKDRVGKDEKFVWTVLSADDGARVELSLHEKIVIDYTKIGKV